MTERRKIIRLALLVPWIALIAVMLSLHLHGVLLRAIVILFALAMTGLFAYVLSQMMKMKKRSTR